MLAAIYHFHNPRGKDVGQLSHLGTLREPTVQHRLGSILDLQRCIAN